MAETLIYGGKTPQARTVVVYGNCQAPFLAGILGALEDLNDDYRFVFAANHAPLGEPQARPVPDVYLQDVVLLLEQYEGRADNPAAQALKPRLPAGCPVVTFPSFIMSSCWPFECPEPRGAPEPGYPWKRYPVGDLIGLQVARAGLTGPLAVAAYLDLSLEKMPDLQVRLQRDIERMHHYDMQCDVELADYVESTFRREHLFWTSNHPSDAGMAELTRRVAAAVRPLLGGSAQSVEAALAAHAGSGGTGDVQLPIHPVVADALGLSFWQPDLGYRWYAQNWTFFEYIQRYIEYDTGW